MSQIRADRETALAQLFPATRQKLQDWQSDPEVLGVLLVGSKSRGHTDAHSDDDLEVLLTGQAFALLAPADCHALLTEGEGESRRLLYDAQLSSLEDLQRKFASPFDLDHWPYERAPVLFERTSEVTRAVEAAGGMAPEFRALRLQHAVVDTSIAIGRAGKTLKRGHQMAGRVLVARGLRAFSRLLFALEWRWSPLEHWLEQELATLRDESGVVPGVLEGFREGRPELLREALNTLEDRLAGEGVPRPEGRTRLFLELIHTSNVEERALHGLS